MITRTGFLMLASLCSVSAQEVAPFPPAPDDVSSLATLVGDSEPGEKLLITGTVYHADRKTPRSDFLLYIYQTDATGITGSTETGNDPAFVDG